MVFLITQPILAASSTDNQCTCTFTTPPVVVCTEYDANHVATLTGRQDNVQEHLDNVTSQLANYADEWSRANERIKEFDRQLSDLIVSCLRSPATPAGSAGNDVMVAGDNFMEEVRRQLLSLEDALATVKENHPDDDILEGIENQVKLTLTTRDHLVLVPRKRVFSVSQTKIAKFKACFINYYSPIFYS